MGCKGISGVYASWVLDSLMTTPGSRLTEFNSNNTQLLTVEQTKEKIASLSYIQEELAKTEK